MKKRCVRGNDIIAIIGIRSGSKTIIDKNIRILNGKPLVHWIIKAALGTPEINRVIVSTDNKKYAQIAREGGAEVPFLRPKKLSQDTSTDYSYVKHCLEYLRSTESYEPKVAVRLMATVPNQRPEDISAIIQNCLAREEVDSSVIVAEARQNPMKALKILESSSGSSRLVSYQTGTGRDVTPQPRQKYEKAYFRANAVAFKPRVITNTGTLTGDWVVPHLIPQDSAVDIDTELDFKFAEFLNSNYD